MKKATTTGAASKPAKKAPAKRAPSASTKTAVKSATEKPTGAPAAVGAPVAVAPKPQAKKPAGETKATTIVAQVDVGFGNRLHIRGEGPGLSWERGVAMECATSDSWTWTTKAASRPFAYKVLINDERWSGGDDYVAAVGAKSTIAPTF